MYFKYKSPSTIWVIIVCVWRVLIDVVEWGMCQYCVQNCLRPLIYLFLLYLYVFFSIKKQTSPWWSIKMLRINIFYVKKNKSLVLLDW